MADSRPGPGPLTLISISCTPYLCALSAALAAAFCAANGVLLRDPLKPTVPALAQHIVSPLMSEIVTYVLLNVALIFAIARVTLRLIFFLPTLDMIIFYPQTKQFLYQLTGLSKLF